MQKFRCIVSLLAIVLCATISTQAQFTRQQAIDTVLNHLVAADTGTIKVFIADSIYTTADTPVTYTGDTITSPYGSYHLFFVDDIPAANWQHACRYLLVSSTTGSVSTVNQTTFPADLNQDYSLIVDTPAHQAFDPGQQPDITAPPANPNGDLYAVLIAGLIRNTNNELVRYSNDMALVYNTLLEKGYTKENIIVHYGEGDWTNPIYEDDFDNDGVCDIDYPAYSEDLYWTFYDLSYTMDEDDVLFVYVTSHGSVWNTGPDWEYRIDLADDGNYLTAAGLAEYVSWINCSQIIFVLQQCHSGGFIPALSSLNNASDVQVYTAANSSPFYNGYSYAEEWLTSNLYDEFTFYWCAAVRGFYPDFAYPWTTNIVTGDFEFDQVHGDNHDGDFDPDSNGDDVISMEEAFHYARHMDTWDEYGEYIPYVAGLRETPMDYDGECNDCQTLRGYEGDVEEAYIVSHGNVIRISGELNVDGLTIGGSGGSIYLANSNSSIQADDLETNNNLTFFARHTSNELRVLNSMQLGGYNVFTSEGPRWDVYLDGDQMQTTINQATFEKCQLNNYGDALTITNSSFDDCYMLMSHKGVVNVSDTDFDRTWLYLENSEDNDNQATVSGCSFTTDVMMAAIDLWNYSKFDISYNQIDGYYNGIQVMQSGYGPARNQNIHHNNIINCTQKGIAAYSSIATIYTNKINNNNYGVWFANNSDIILHGYTSANSCAQTQVIRDNSKYEVYASQYSFPIYFRYNCIIDDDNTGGASDALVYHNAGSGVSKDVRYNCWEEAAGSFVSTQDLYPGGYSWDPVWCPGGGSDRISGEDEDMYEVAVNLFESEGYAGAKLTYQTLIGQYPESKFAKAAMQELFALEQYVSDDYNSLKQYYTTNSTIQSDPVLSESGEYLATKCDIKTTNWPDAVSYYENIILYPESLEDSIFAIIDLGYVYFMMENSGQKSACTGNLIQHKPKTKDEFFENRDYLLSLLPGEYKNEPEAGPEGETEATIVLNQNSPNPATETTLFSFKIDQDALINISLYDYTGTKIKELYRNFSESGTHSVAVDVSNLSPGVYFYSIFSNKQKISTKKMIVL